MYYLFCRPNGHCFPFFSAIYCLLLAISLFIHLFSIFGFSSKSLHYFFSFPGLEIMFWCHWFGNWSLLNCFVNLLYPFLWEPTAHFQSFTHIHTPHSSPPKPPPPPKKKKNYKYSPLSYARLWSRGIATGRPGGTCTPPPPTKKKNQYIIFNLLFCACLYLPPPQKCLCILKICLFMPF